VLLQIRAVAVRSLRQPLIFHRSGFGTLASPRRTSTLKSADRRPR
jgi:hypothetical protein